MAGASVHLCPLEGDAGLQNAKAVADQLRLALASTSQVVLDTSRIDKADLTTAQTLLAAHRSARAAGKSFVLAAPPGGALRQFLIQAGFIAEDGSPLSADHQFWSPTPSSPARDKVA